MPWTRADDDPRYHTADWRRARIRALREANWRCEIRLEGCAGAASQVDHVDGIDADPQHTNLRAACTPCHRKVTAKQGGGYRGKSRPDPTPAPRTAW